MYSKNKHLIVWLSKHHAINRSGGTAPLILNVSIRYRGAASFRPLHPVKELPVTIKKEARRSPQPESMFRDEKNLLLLLDVEPHFFGHSAHTESSRYTN